MDQPEPQLTPTHLVFALIGLAMMLVAGFFIFFSTLIAPLWAVFLLWLVWLSASLWAWRAWRRSMFAPLIAGVGVSFVWIVAINLGDAFLGWTA